MITEPDGRDCVLEFAKLLHSSQQMLSESAFAKSSTIESHIIQLSLRKLAISASNDQRAFDTTEIEQKRLAIEGIKIIQLDLARK
jgi:hypothetical protein